MRLTIKITLAILLGVVLIFSVYSYLSIQREREQLKRNLSREARHIGESLRVIVTELWQQRGEDEALGFLLRANQGYSETLVRWVWIRENSPLSHQPRVPLAHLDRLRFEETVTLMAASDEGYDFLLTYLPVLIPGEDMGAIELTESMEEMHDYIQESLRRSAIVVAALVVSGLLLMTVLGSIWVGRPMRKLRAQAERIGTGDFTTSVNLSGSDELAELSSTIERMRGQLAQARDAEQAAQAAKFEALEKLRHTERLATLGQLSAGMAHELGTPLNVIAGRAKLIAREGLPAEDITRSANIIHEQAQRMTGIMRQLLSFARRGEARKQPVDINLVIHAVLPLLEPTLNKQQVEFCVEDTPSELLVYADAAQLQQVLLNLILNGIHAMPAGGKITLSCFAATTVTVPDSVANPDQSWACLQVTDEGSGIDPEVQQRMFDPFFTTKDVGEGTGLGLSIAYGIIQEHGGWIAVDSVPGNGSSFRVYLPLACRGGAA
ncbi:MAG: HAMP domain-containing protein [Desulfuromonadales bacterium]|nr:HAMP domain-containing protein [Desulfuromonadales bacterium]